MQRYKNSNENGKLILRTLKLLNEGNIYPYRVNIVKDICSNIFELSNEVLKRHSWDNIINNLIEGNFIKINNNTIYIYTSYLDYCVYDYNPLNDLMNLRDLFVKQGDYTSLYYLGNRFSYRAEFHKARDCYTKALTINQDYSAVRNGLGYVLRKLGQIEGANGRLGSARQLLKDSENEIKSAIELKPSYAPYYGTI